MRRALFALMFLAACKDSAPTPAPTPTATPTPTPTLTPAPTPTPTTLEERALALHRASIVLDSHNDVTTAILDHGFDLGRPDGTTMTDIPRMKAGGLSAEFFSIYVDKSYVGRAPLSGGGAARRALDMIDATYRQIERHADDLVLATTAADVRRAKKAGKIAVLMGIEGGHAIEDSLGALRGFFRLGVRYMSLTHGNTNDWADSAGMPGAPAPALHRGLTPFGEEVVREMQRLGMLVDVSHSSDETFDAVLRIARCPVIASHSSSRAIAAMGRNLSDDQMRALAKSGGVVMINFYPGFLDAHWNEAPHTLPLGRLVDHIEHAMEVAGADHVGLGSDFDGVPSMPDGLGGIDGLPRITVELLRRGHSDDDVRLVLGEAFLRAFEAAERCAAETKTSVSGDGSTRKP